MPGFFGNACSFGKEGRITKFITIITEGSPGIGFGHLRRSVTLARELSSHVPVHFWILSDAEAPQLADDIRGHLDGMDWQLSDELPSVQADVEIVDLEQSKHLRLLEQPVGRIKRCLALDWTNPARLPSITVNLLDHSGKMLAAYEAAGRRGDYRAGADYAIIRPGILALRTDAPTPETVREIVVTMGGADPSRRTLEAVQLLHDLPGRVCVTVIVGPFVPREYENAIRAAAPKHFKFFRNPPDFDRHLAQADVVLCSGGGTLLESLALGKPAVVFPQNEAEEEHGRLYRRADACVFVDSLAALLGDHALRLTLAKNARQQVDGRGVKRIVQAAFELLRRCEDQPILA